MIGIARDVSHFIMHFLSKWLDMCCTHMWAKSNTLTPPTNNRIKLAARRLRYRDRHREMDLVKYDTSPDPLPSYFDIKH